VGSERRQHNPNARDGPEAIVEFMTELMASNPEACLDIKRVIVEGDLVVTHSHIRMSPADAGTAVADIYRLEDGKIVEHWDVLQPVPPTAANDNTMF
jgi:predicted SnoaL-like aldol condensation-catalyzing enzyme